MWKKVLNWTLFLRVWFIGSWGGLYLILKAIMANNQLLYITVVASKTVNIKLGHCIYDLGSESDADWGSGSKDHFASTQQRSEVCAVLCDTAPGQCVRSQWLAHFEGGFTLCYLRAMWSSCMRPHWIQIGDPDPVNPVSVPMWRAPLQQRITDLVRSLPSRWESSLR